METLSNGFGKFLYQKRMDKKVSYRELAKALQVTAPYVNDIEKGRRNPPTMDVLERIANYFALSDAEREKMFDLAVENRNVIAPDIPKFIQENNYVVAALRQARDLDATEKDWEEFIRELRERKRQGGS